MIILELIFLIGIYRCRNRWKLYNQNYGISISDNRLNLSWELSI